MTVTWTELPPDAPEPGPLSVVADGFGTQWFRIEKATYTERWAGVSGENAGDLTSWDAIERPLSLYVPGGDPDAVKSCDHPDPVDALYITEAAARLAVEHHKTALELTTDASLVATATALAGFLRGETGTGES